jgi:hypothetical protein
VTPVAAVTRATAAAAGLPGRGDADAGGADGHAVKCALDQLFFASQGDVLFLALCAYHDSADVPEAIAEVKRNSLTTWINDCAVWPLVNLVGFAALPTSLLPSYMAAMQLFWQLSLSFASQHTHQQQHAAHAAALRPPPGAEAQRGGPAGVRDADAARGPAAPPDASARGATVPASVLAAQPLLAPVPCDDAALEAVFAGFDADGNGRIDADELRAALLRRGVALTTAEAVGMVRAVDRDGDASVDLLEFKSIARVQGAGAQGVEAKLWKAAITRQHLRLLEKQSLRGAVKRHEQFERAKVRRRSPRCTRRPRRRWPRTAAAAAARRASRRASRRRWRQRPTARHRCSAAPCSPRSSPPPRRPSATWTAQRTRSGGASATTPSATARRGWACSD